jgi:hypothetical protein
MTFPRARLVVSATLFLAWLGYLLLLVNLSRNTIVLSRPQFLVARLWVVAELADNGGKPAPEVRVVDVAWSADPADQQLKGARITIGNLPEATGQGYIGPGPYILPLRKTPDKNAAFRIVTVPPSPGYNPAFVKVTLFDAGADPKRTAEAASEHLGLSAEEAGRRVEAVVKGTPTVLAEHVPHDQAEAFRRALAGDGPAPHGLDLDFVGNDIRIYPRTPETGEQLDELRSARQGSGPTRWRRKPS